ncbi:MAG: hypothetical protein R3B13_18585, partial [Polyangiaceae bacterium]
KAEGDGGGAGAGGVAAASGVGAASSGGVGASGGTGNGGGTGGESPDWPSCGKEVCGAEEFCDFMYDFCSIRPDQGGGPDLSRSCKKRDSTCDSATPVCGCDGVTYASQCAAQQAGVDIGGPVPGESSKCAVILPGHFPCGPLFCDASTSYCRYRYGDAGDRFVECVDWPPNCAGTCACVPKPVLQCLTVPGNGVTGVVDYSFMF